ncbi:SIR2 family NAD-dependent protein deacylase, partial [Paenibacillus naphthalenovorans]|uniref:SIR2 family NAD-dependent protein deacylase n=1 Tax=Paenibacillus naphthalenovorans TaxID=162209 RepID=UPI003D2B0F2B
TKYFTVPNHPMDVISAYSYEYSRTKLIEKLTDFLHITDATVGEVHKSFCKIPFDIVCTTNFDFLLERGYEKLGKYYKPIIEEQQLPIAIKQIQSNNDPNVTLLKLHGDIHHPNRMVATEQDYDSFLNTYPLISTFMSNLLITRTPLFIGYSIDDPDFRQIWKVIQDRLGNLCRPAYTIAVNANESYISKYSRRGVKVINIPGKSYSEVFEVLFEEIREYWIKNWPHQQQFSNDPLSSELLLPIDSISRLCYFSISNNSIKSFYKNYIYDIAKEFGFLPISIDEVYTVGSNIIANEAALLERAELIIIDYEKEEQLSNINTLLLSSKKNIKVLIVTSKGKGDFAIYDKGNVSYSYIHRSSDLFSDYFMDDIRNWFESNIVHIKNELKNEPLRLFEIKAYGPAVISSIALLERYFSGLIKNKTQSTSSKMIYPLSKLVQEARRLQIISPTEADKIYSWIQYRNTAAHGMSNIPRNVAREIVNGVNELIRGWDEAAVTWE